ncbi:MAG TPA: hypothetical protein VGF21_09135 [Thermoleophilaceae bacterium]
MSRVAALQALAARGRPGLVVPGAAAYRALAESAAAYLRRGTGAHVYARGSLARAEVVPGLSDLDLVAVLPDGSDRPELALALLSMRRRVVAERFPVLARLVSTAVYSESELRSAAGSNVWTWALEAEVPGGPRAQATYFRSAAPEDELGLRLRPGVPGGCAGWVPLGPAPPAPATPALTGVERLQAAWLELQYWWRHAFGLAREPATPVAHYMCVKLVAESARTCLWLSEGEVPPTRREALERSDDPAAAGALAIERKLPAAAAPPVADALGALVRGSQRVAARLREEADRAGYDEVELHETKGPVPFLSHEAEGPAPVLSHETKGPVPFFSLVDWRARAFSEQPDERCFVADGEAGDPRALAAAASRGASPQPLLRAGDDLLVAPAAQPLPLRGVECPVTDPVTFALLAGESVARFPRLPGWSARDCARRAVAEHRSWIADWSREPLLSERAHGLLLTAARAAAFLESVESGSPALPLTVAAAVEALGWPREALDDLDTALRLVRRLPAYAEA